MSDDILTIKEVAEYLKIKEKTAYALAAKGEIPGFKVGGSWRFRRKPEPHRRGVKWPASMSSSMASSRGNIS